MRNLNNIELEFVTKCPVILNEEVIRPIKKKKYSKSEKLNNGFAAVSYELNSYSISNDEKLRNIHSIVNTFKDEDKSDIIDVVKSYYPKISKSDISKIVENSLLI
jgi:hypothetical protein